MQKELEGPEAGHQGLQFGPDVPDHKPPAPLKPGRYQPAGPESGGNVDVFISLQAGLPLVNRQVNAVKGAPPVTPQAVEDEGRAGPRPHPRLENRLGLLQANQGVKDRPGRKTEPAPGVSVGAYGLGRPNLALEISPEPPVQMKLRRVEGHPGGAQPQEAEGRGLG